MKESSLFLHNEGMTYLMIRSSYVYIPGSTSQHLEDQGEGGTTYTPVPPGHVPRFHGVVARSQRAVEPALDEAELPLQGDIDIKQDYHCLSPRG